MIDLLMVSAALALLVIVISVPLAVFLGLSHHTPQH